MKTFLTGYACGFFTPIIGIALFYAAFLWTCGFQRRPKSK
jgi:hypothetical protein